MARIQTVSGDILPELLGHCQIHEHIWVEDTPAAQLFPQLCIDLFAESLAELKHFHAAGGRSIVDAQPVGAGRNVLRLAELATQSQIQIITVTGFHRPMFYSESHWIHSIPSEEAAELFASEIIEGAFIGNESERPTKRSTIKAGLVKAALGKDPMDDWTLRLLTAVGQAAVSTGSALMLHTESGQHAVEAIRMLEKLGLPAMRVIVCHVDRQTENLAPHLNIAKTGAYLDYDTIGRFKYHDDASEVILIQQMIAAGHLDQLMLSLDTTAQRLAAYGGEIGLDYLFKSFIPQLQQADITSLACQKMLIDNPSRILCLVN
jgi:phosphotriesterase-related protein